MKEWPYSFASDPAMSSALRELRQVAGARRTWLLLAAVSILAGVAGPFGTFVDLHLPQRLAYWSLVVAGSFFIAVLSLSLTDGWLAVRVRWPLAVIAIGALIAGLPISAFVVGLEAVFGRGASDAFIVYAHAAAICFGVNLVFCLSGNRPAASLEAAPAILRRLPPSKRGRLIRISVRDHYVDVVTDRGRNLVLMRLTDAITETQPEPGLRVHRSHWVSFHGVIGCVRSNGRLFLRTRDGTRVPVSRRYRPAVHDARLDG